MLADAGNFLWEAATANVGLVSVISQLSVFAPALESALRGRSLSGAGLVQLMTCDHPRQVFIFPVLRRVHCPHSLTFS